MNEKITPLEFWSQVWTEGQIRFHQSKYNQHMVSYFDSIDLKDKTVLIPLAGKSKDILYFLEKGARVTAIEFCEEAVALFFEENNITFTKDHNRYLAKNLVFVAGDFFDFKSHEPFDVLYDRASQVVFDKVHRPKYFEHVTSLVNESSILLLFSIDHDGSPDYGPPYKISKQEIMDAYQKKGIKLVTESESTEVASEKMQASGIVSLHTFTLKNEMF